MAKTSGGLPEVLGRGTCSARHMATLHRTRNQVDYSFPKRDTRPFRLSHGYVIRTLCKYKLNMKNTCLNNCCSMSARIWRISTLRDCRRHAGRYCSLPSVTAIYMQLHVGVYARCTQPCFYNQRAKYFEVDVEAVSMRDFLSHVLYALIAHPPAVTRNT